jgi:phospholipase C
MAVGGMSRRTFLGGSAAAAAALAVSRGGTLATAPSWAGPVARRNRLVLPPGSRPFPSKPEGIDTLPQVEHVVIYMQENHSFDNYFGLLGRGDGLTLGPGGLPTNTNPDSHGNPVPMFHMTSECDLTESASQTWNGTHLSWNHGAMDGFVTSANDATGSMGYWDKTDLPFYDALANTFVLCDRWFASAPCQTLPNRRFLQAGTSGGIVTSDPAELAAFPNVPNGCIWERFNDLGISWKDYAIDLADILLFVDFYKANSKHIHPFDDFLLDAQTGSLPQVSIISPGHHDYSEENPGDLQLGEAYSSSIINALMHGPAWEKTVLLFMYDEHGGYYDHVPNPAAIAPDSIPPNTNVPPDEPGGFDLYGMRVPAMVISPFAKKDYVSSVVHDHTSVLKFLETKFNIGALTLRDANADDLMDCFDFAGAPFRDPPTLPEPGLPASGSTCSDVPPPKTSVPVPTSTTTTTTSTPGAVAPATAPGATPVGAATGFTG